MRVLPLAALLIVLSTPRLAQTATITETLGDASIGHDADAGTWTIGAGGATLTIAAGPSRDFQIVSLVSASGRSWLAGPSAGTTVTVAGHTLAFGSRAAGFEHEDVTTSNDEHVLRLDAAYVLPSVALRVTRHVAVADGSPTFEMWTTFEALGRSASVSDLNAFELAVAAGTVHWLNGLQGDAADIARDTAFTLRQQDVASGAPLVLGAQGRSSEQTVPWFAIDGAHDELYAGLMWSGAWTLRIERTRDTLGVAFGLPAMTTTVQRTPVDGPHAILGVAAGGLPQASAALRSYVRDGVRRGRDLSALVTYNTWFAYGTAIDEASMRDEMSGAAALGTELFVIDAGWYRGAGAADAFDFDSGLGSWEADPARFPDGLASLSDYAHSLGMKFGVWVEPERVNLSTVGTGEAESVAEPWLVTNSGSYGSDHSALICLSGSSGRQWVLDRLAALVDSVHPDYLKWDNNLWVNCDRAGHGHEASDGNFAQVAGLYQVLDALRARYPDLLIENVSGGGNRLDFGMLRYSDVAWMDDRTAPSVHVRHNLEGLTTAFPPSYLLSFVTNHDGEPLHDAPDLSLYFRSRMGGALGLCFLTAELSEADATQIGREVDIYKNVRVTLSVAAGALLSPQAAATGGPDWDVLQAAAPDGDAIIFIYSSDDASDAIIVRPADLLPDTTYSVQSVDGGALGAATGADLMANGVDVMQSPNSAAHSLVLRAQ